MAFSEMGADNNVATWKPSSVSLDPSCLLSAFLLVTFWKTDSPVLESLTSLTEEGVIFAINAEVGFGDTTPPASTLQEGKCVSDHDSWFGAFALGDALSPVHLIASLPNTAQLKPSSAPSCATGLSLICRSDVGSLFAQRITPWRFLANNHVHSLLHEWPPAMPQLFTKFFSRVALVARFIHTQPHPILAPPQNPRSCSSAASSL